MKPTSSTAPANTASEPDLKDSGLSYEQQNGSAGGITDTKIRPKAHPPMPGKVCLQSSRLLPATANDLNLSNERIEKMELLLTELGVPVRPMATRAVCDLHDEVRRSTIALLSIQAVIQKKEKELAILHSNAVKLKSKCTIVIPQY
jgi:hypothetical protein